METEAAGNARVEYAATAVDPRPFRRQSRKLLPPRAAFDGLIVYRCGARFAICRATALANAFIRRPVAASLELRATNCESRASGYVETADWDGHATMVPSLGIATGRSRNPESCWERMGCRSLQTALASI